MSLLRSLLVVSFLIQHSLSFNLLFMARRGKGKINQALSNKPKNLGQEITGVTLPADGQLKGWEFGEGVRMACGNVNGQFYAIQGDCPRCGFDLWKGDLIADDPAWDELPRVACPTCSSTFSMRTGKQGESIKRTGLQAFVGNLAKTATQTDSFKGAKVFAISRDNETGQVYCKER